MMKMNKLIGKILFKSTFWTVDFTGWLANTSSFGRWEWPYRLYQEVAHWSLKINDHFGLDYWKKP